MTKVQRLQKRIITPLIDSILSKTISKKLIAFSIATIGLFKDKLTGAEWTFITCLYLFGLLWLNHLEKMVELKKEKYFTNNDNTTINLDNELP